MAKRKYRINVQIQNVDKGTDQSADVQLGMFEADDISDLVKLVSKITPKEDAATMHERLVAAQNKEPDAIVTPNQPAGDHAGD